MSIREMLRLPQPLLSFNKNSGTGTILARPGENISAKEAASDIAQDCCPLCKLYYTRDPERYAVCRGMREDTQAAAVKQRGRDPLKTKTDIFLLSECTPRE